MAVQTESPTLGRGTDWNSFYKTEPLQANDPFSPSAFGQLLFAEPDAASARELLGIADAIGAITFADIGGTLSLDQLPPGSLATVDDIGVDAMYFFTESTGLPSLINAAEVASFISGTIGFSDLAGTISIDQFPPGSVASLDSIDEDALYFFDNTLFVPKLISAADARNFLLPGQTGQDGKFLQTNAGTLSWTAASGVVDGQILYDDSHIESLDAGERYVKDAAGNIHIDWSNANFTAYRRPIWIYGPSPNQNYTLLLSANGIAVQYYPGGSDTLTSNQYTSFDPVGNALYIGLSDGTNGFLVNKRVLTWQGSSISEGQTTLPRTDVIFFPDSTNQPYFRLSDDTHAQLYVDDVRNYTDDESLNVDLLNRKLYAHDGATVILDYSTDLVTARASLGITSGGDASTNTSSSVDSEVALFSGTGGKTIKRATGSGLAVLTSGVLSTTTNNSSNWDTAFTERRQWDGGATNLVAATGRTSLGLVIGTNVQAWDADLDTLAGLTATTNNFIVSVGSAWASRTPTQVKSTLAIANTDVSGLGTASTLASDTDGTLATNSDSRIATQKAVKTYVDGINTALLAAIAALDSKDEVAYCSTSALPTCTYSNGTLGVGATLTATTNGPLIIDGVTTVIGAQGLGILVAGQASAFQNGWYTLTQQGVVAVSPWILTRRTPDDQAAEIGPGYLTAVEAPTALTAGSNNQRVFLSISPVPFVVGTDSLTFAMVGGTYTAGNGLSLSGTAFSINTSITADLSTVQSLSNKTFVAPILGTPTSGTLTNCTFPTLNQNTTGSAATLTTARAIYGNNFDGSAALTQIIASTYGGTGNGFTKFSGPTTAERTKSLRDASDTILELGGSYTPTGTWTSLTMVTPVIGTPTSGTLTNCTGLPVAGLTASTSTALGVGSIELGHASDTTIARVSAGIASIEGSNIIMASNLGTNVLTFLGTPTSANLRSALTDELGTGAALFDGATLTALLTFATCGSSLASFNVPAGTVPTTPNDGDFFADANCFYGCTDAGNPGVIPIIQIIRADSTVTQANDANAHAIFTTPTNGRLTLETGTYEFRGKLAWTSMSATSGNVKIDILGAGTATTGSWLWISSGVDGASGIPGTQQHSWNITSATGTNAVTAATNISCFLVVDGTFEVTVAGTIIPTQTLVTAAAAVLSVGSYIEFWRVGSTTMTSVGQWD